MVEPRALRRIVSHIEEMTAAGYDRDPAAAYRLSVLNRRASVRVATAAEELAAAAGARGATVELRSLDAAVRSGKTTWENCVAGRADHLRVVRAWQASTVRRARVVPAVPGDDDEDTGPILRRRD